MKLITAYRGMSNQSIDKIEIPMCKSISQSTTLRESPFSATTSISFSDRIVDENFFDGIFEAS